MKKKTSFFKLILVLLIMVYATLVTAKSTNLIEMSNRRQIELTNKEIDEFESMLDKGEKVDLDKYISEKKDYTNFFSKLGLSISNGVSFLLNDGMGGLVKFILKIFS